MAEGCLSIPAVFVEVERAKEILVEYTDQEGQKVRKKFNELMARVFLHEYDHLKGVLILDYVTKKEREKLISQFEKFLKEKKGNGPDHSGARR